MKIVEPSAIIETPFWNHPTYREAILAHLERCTRTAYKSEHKIGLDTAGTFMRRITQIRKHESCIEHASATVRFVVDRGVSHELVRHRLASFTQESTRYCNYSDEVHGSEITVIRPPFWSDVTPEFIHWESACSQAETCYFKLLNDGASPQQARAVLPNSLKTEVVMTCNLREWRHVFSLRCSPAAHPQMRQVMLPLYTKFATKFPEIFDDLPEAK